MVVENCPTARYQDGIHFYMLNAQHREKQINPALQEFLDTVRDNNWTVDGSKTKLGRMVRNEVMRVREDRKVGEKYMSYAVKLQDQYMEGEKHGIAIGESRGEKRGIAIGEQRGRIAGRQEGEKHGRLETLLSLVRHGVIPLTEAAKWADKSEAELQKLL